MADSKRVEFRAVSCDTDSDGYGVIHHGLGVAPEEILLQSRIPAGQKHFDLSVVTSSYTATEFRVRAINHDGTPRANKKTYVTYLAQAVVPVDPPPPPPDDESDEEPQEPQEPQNPVDPRVCTSPSKTWTTRQGGGAVHAPNVGDGLQYYGSPNLWNDNGTVSLTMGVCSHASWYVDAKAQNKGDGAVLAYPNLHKDWINWSNEQMPRIRDYARIPTKFAHDGPGDVGIWNWAYDLWIDGVGNDDGVTELMIWTEWKTQRPAGNKVKTVTIEGREWDLWRAAQWGIVSYTAKQQFKSGTLDLRKFTDHLVSEGIIRADSKLGQVGYGPEIVDTGGATRRFNVLDFQVDAYKS